MARSTAIQRHAITAPVFGRGKLHRHRLVEILQANLDKRLILVVAPAGYGKSMLLADLTAHVDRPVCWVRLTEHDRDAARLARVLFDSLSARFRRFRRHLDLRGMEAVPPGNLGRLMGAAVAEAEIPAFVLAFDDIHLVASSKDTTALLAGLVDGLPRHVSCILAGREPLDLPLAKVAAADEVLAVGAGDLALADDELEELLKVDGTSEASAEIRGRLLTETRGWIAGIQLLRMRGLEALEGSLPSPKELTFEYFGSEVLGKQTEAMRRFAIESSVLPVMTAEAVEAVVRVKDGARWLREAVRRGLFISATGSSPRSYEYHPLFREYLASALEPQTETQSRDLMARAGAYLARNGEADEGFELFLRASQPNRALRVAERSARTMSRLGRVDTLTKWDRLLRARGIVSPWLLLRISYLYAEWGRYEEALPYWRQGLRAARAAGNSHLVNRFALHRARLDLFNGRMKSVLRRTDPYVRPSAARPIRREDLAEALALRANALLEGAGDLNLAVNCAKRAEQLLHRLDAAWKTGPSLTLWATLAWSGRRVEAIRLASECRRIPRHLITQNQLLMILSNTGADRVLDGDFQEALGYFDEAMRLAQKAGSLFGEALVLLNLGDLYSDVGRPHDALHFYERGQAVMEEAGGGSLARYLGYRKTVALRRCGDLGAARKELARVASLPGDAWNRELEVERVALERGGSARARLGRLRRLRRGNLSALKSVILGAHIVEALHQNGLVAQAEKEVEMLLEAAAASWMLVPLAGELAASPDLRQLASSAARGAACLDEVTEYVRRGAMLPQVPSSPGKRNREDGALVIRALGGLRVEAFGRDLAVKPKTLEVLLCLADRGRIPVDELAEIFWGHLPARKRAANVHSTIYTIRQELGQGAISTSGGVVSLTSAIVIDYDVAEFQRSVSAAIHERRAGRASASSLGSAAALYRAPFAPALDREWARQRRSELQDALSELVRALGEAALAEGVPSDAIAPLRRSLSWQPHRQDLAALLSRCLQAAGRHVEASAVAAALERSVGPDSRATALSARPSP